jgi:hypothetical protein
MAKIDTVRKLIALAASLPADSEEARTAAYQACKMLADPTNGIELLTRVDLDIAAEQVAEDIRRTHQPPTNPFIDELDNMFRNMNARQAKWEEEQRDKQWREQQERNRQARIRQEDEYNRRQEAARSAAKRYVIPTEEDLEAFKQKLRTEYRTAPDFTGDERRRNHAKGQVVNPTPRPGRKRM